MRSKEELELLINEQKEIFEGVRDTLSDLRDERARVVELPKRKEYIGRFFKSKNSFGADTDIEAWWVYARVVEALDNGMIGSSELRVVSFEKDGFGDISVDSQHLKMISQLGEEITEAEFLREWAKLQAEMALAVEGGMTCQI